MSSWPRRLSSIRNNRGSSEVSSLAQLAVRVSGGSHARCRFEVATAQWKRRVKASTRSHRDDRPRTAERHAHICPAISSVTARQERPFGSAPFHIRWGPVRPGASGGDIDLNGHSQIIRGETGPSTVQRYRLAWIAHHRDTRGRSCGGACRIEIDPAGAGQIDLDPGVRVSAAGIAVVVMATTCRYRRQSVRPSQASARPRS
jgi:hypothetical protein